MPYAQASSNPAGNRRLLRVSLLGVAVVVGAGSVRAQSQAPPVPLTLQQAVHYATEHYPAIQASMARVSAQQAGVDLARTAYLPRVDYGLQVNRATRNNVAGLLLPGTPVPSISGPASDSVSSSSIWGSATGLLLSWEALDFGLRGATVGLAHAEVTRARASAALTRLEVGVRTADAFLQLAAAQETVRAARANVERQEVFAGAVAVLVRNELRPGADNSRAQAELALARIQLIQAEQAEQIARANLAQWLGVAPAAVQIAAAPLLEMAPPRPAALPIVTAHPLAETQRAAVESSRALQTVIGRSYVPRINFQTAYSVRGSGALANGGSLGGARGLDFDTPNWAAGVTATFPLFDWFAVREQTRIEAQNERAELAGYDRVVRELSSQSEQARAEMDGALRIAQNTPIQLTAARVLEQQSRARYDAGLATIIEVADAQRLLLQSEVGDAVARLGVWRALVADAAARGDLSELLN
ncbi:MAG: TolC family protein [Acidobacteria bacterium]|nr:TolC family protein [Acidobacteriota bacterium]